MVSLNRYGEKPNIALSEFTCLSTDTKPTASFNGIAIANGSTLYEMDTHKAYIYDQENDEWLEV